MVGIGCLAVPTAAGTALMEPVVRVAPPPRAKPNRSSTPSATPTTHRT
jgi:hypothetical protein